jgi:hypothetical protein
MPYLTPEAQAGDRTNLPPKHALSLLEGTQQAEEDHQLPGLIAERFNKVLPLRSLNGRCTIPGKIFWPAKKDKEVDRFHAGFTLLSNT